MSAYHGTVSSKSPYHPCADITAHSGEGELQENNANEGPTLALALADLSPGQGVVERLASADMPQVQQDGAQTHSYDASHRITYYKWIMQGITRFQEGIRDIGGTGSLASSQSDHDELYAEPDSLHPENILFLGLGMNLYDAIDILFPDIKGNTGVISNVDQGCPAVRMSKRVNPGIMQAQWELGHSRSDHNKAFQHEPNPVNLDKGLAPEPYNRRGSVLDASNSTALVDNSPSSFPSPSLSLNAMSPLPLPTPKATPDHLPLRRQGTTHQNKTVPSRYSMKQYRFTPSKPSPSPNEPIFFENKKGRSRAMLLSERDVIAVSPDLLPYLGNVMKEAPFELLSSFLQQTENGKWTCPFSRCKHNPYASKSSAIFHVRQHIGNCCHPCGLCPYRAYQTNDLTNHISKHHGGGTLSPPPTHFFPNLNQQSHHVE
ncbi:hypothetical protein CPB86DRAFT_872940 [Serendipita vermifera]|nr:hypothetical protein CPB86DRAFT_872940 [Serendipita vermifera]